MMVKSKNTAMAKKTVLLILCILALVSLFMLGSAWYSGQKTQRFLQTATSTTGTVIELKQEISRGRSGQPIISYYPVIEFVNQNEQRVTFRSSASVDRYQYPVNEQVKVLYQQNNPQEAQLDSFGSLWGMTLVFTVLGVAFSCATFIVYGFMYREKKLDNLSLTGIIFGLAGILLYIGAWWTSQDSWYLVKNGIQTTGTIVIGSAAPVIEFHTQEGKIMQYQSPLSTHPPAYSQGDKVPILYDLYNPKRASINSFAELWLIGTVMVGMGTLFLIICLGAFYFGKTNKNQ